VRQYYLRSGAKSATCRSTWSTSTTATSRATTSRARLRPALAPSGKRHGASVKVVEVPPGPPVLSPLVAEVYGPDYAGRRRWPRAGTAPSRHDRAASSTSTPAWRRCAARAFLRVDRSARALGIRRRPSPRPIARAVGADATYLHDGGSKYPRAGAAAAAAQDQASLDALLALPCAAANGQLVPLSELVRVERGVMGRRDPPQGPAAGGLRGRRRWPATSTARCTACSPSVGQQVRRNARRRQTLGSTSSASRRPLPPATRSSGTASGRSPTRPSATWASPTRVGLVLIYLLVVAQFRSYLVPLVIMAPIPLTVIGVMPGHALLGAQFTATSMIGMIALAGIIVRNSILLVDFINLRSRAGVPLARP
jgi:multidrug efflux pump subunit AcrB